MVLGGEHGVQICRGIKNKSYKCKKVSVLPPSKYGDRCGRASRFDYCIQAFFIVVNGFRRCFLGEYGFSRKIDHNLFVDNFSRKRNIRQLGRTADRRVRVEKTVYPNSCQKNFMFSSKDKRIRDFCFLHQRATTRNGRRCRGSGQYRFCSFPVPLIFTSFPAIPVIVSAQTAEISCEQLGD